jgi:hypothetical protein
MQAPHVPFATPEPTPPRAVLAFLAPFLSSGRRGGRLGLLLALSLGAAFTACGSDDGASADATHADANTNEALTPCSSGDFTIPPPARPAISSEQGKVSLTPTGTATVRFHGRTSGGPSWVASGLDDLAYGYFLDEAGGQVSFDLRLLEEAEPGSPPVVGKPRTTTVRLLHTWRPGANGALCSAPTAALSVHETIDDESVSALAGTVNVTAFDPDARHLQVSFEAETTAYRIFVDLDVTGNVGAPR